MGGAFCVAEDDFKISYSQSYTRNETQPEQQERSPSKVGWRSRLGSGRSGSHVGTHGSRPFVRLALSSMSRPFVRLALTSMS